MGLNGIYITNLTNVRYLTWFTGSAGSLLIQEAGGFISGIRQEDFLTSGEVIAANPKLFGKLNNLINQSKIYAN